MPNSAHAITVAELDAQIASFDWDAWKRGLTDILDPAFRDVATEQGARAAEAYAMSWDKHDPFLTRHFTSYLGARITQLDETTQETVTEELHRVLESDDGQSATAIAATLADRVDDSAAFSQDRALMIARTETAIAYNTGAVAAYRQNGVATVVVSDGDGDEECAAADGQEWSLDDALDNPVAHPNCERSFAPSDTSADADSA